MLKVIAHDGEAMIGEGRIKTALVMKGLQRCQHMAHFINHSIHAFGGHHGAANLEKQRITK